MITFLKRTHRYLYFASVFIFFILFFPVLYFFAKKPNTYYNQIASIRKWISVLGAYAVGIRFEVIYESPIDWTKPYVICPNHTSTLDITALTYLCPVPFSFMGKIELLANPVTKIFFESIDIPVDRQSKISSYKAFIRANELLKSGKNVVVFPEGKIDDEYPPRLHPFKTGPFRMAIENQVAILPIVIHNAWEIMWDDGKKFGTRPNKVYISVLQPINSQNNYPTDFTSLEDEVYSKMNESWRLKNLKK